MSIIMKVSYEFQYFYIKVRITSMGILNICNLWILLRKIVIYCQMKMSSSWTFSLLKLTEVMPQRESLYMKTSLQISAMTSLPSTLTAKKSMKMIFSSDKTYYNFSKEKKSKSSNSCDRCDNLTGTTLMSRRQKQPRYFRKPLYY